MNSIRSELASLIAPDDRSRNCFSAGLFQIFCAILSSFCAALAAELITESAPVAGHLAQFAALFFIGTRWRALGNVIHECSHGIFVEKAADNAKIGHVLACFEFSDFQEYCKQHPTHHANLGDPEFDLDFRERLCFLADQKPSVRRVMSTILTALMILPLWLKQTRLVFWSKNSPSWSNTLRMVLLLLILASVFHTQTMRYTLLYVLVPYFTTYQWMKLFSDCADHIFLYGNENEVDRSRNHIFRIDWLNRLIFPRNDAYHLLHHLFPALPTEHYRKVHQKFLKNPWYARKQHNLQFHFGNSGHFEIQTQGQSK